MFQRVVKRFLKSEGGQGLAEYCLISALLAILGLGIYLMAGGSKALTQDDSTNVQTSGARR
jgi:Flp pilus assembly pilin Flp